MSDVRGVSVYYNSNTGTLFLIEWPEGYWRVLLERSRHPGAIHYVTCIETPELVSSVVNFEQVLRSRPISPRVLR